MTAEILKFGGGTYLDVPNEKVLDGAKAADLESVLVLGWNKDGTFYAASSDGELGHNTLLAQRFIHAVMTGDFKTGVGDR